MRKMLIYFHAFSRHAARYSSERPRLMSPAILFHPALTEHHRARRHASAFRRLMLKEHEQRHKHIRRSLPLFIATVSASRHLPLPSRFSIFACLCAHALSRRHIIMLMLPADAASVIARRRDAIRDARCCFATRPPSPMFRFYYFCADAPLCRYVRRSRLLAQRAPTTFNMP